MENITTKSAAKLRNLIQDYFLSLRSTSTYKLLRFTLGNKQINKEIKQIVMIEN